MYSPPFSLVEFWQQAGRAGRDGKLATATILYSDAELKAKVPGVDKTMAEFIQNSTDKCLRKMVLEHLNDSFAVGSSQSERCCGYCNPDLSMLEYAVDDEKKKGKRVRKAKDKMISKELKDRTKEALTNLRLELAIRLTEGSKMHGMASCVFGDPTLEKIVDGMDKVNAGRDVIELCDGRVHLYADEVAAKVCELKDLAKLEMVEVTKKVSRRGKKIDLAQQNMMNTFRLEKK